MLLNQNLSGEFGHQITGYRVGRRSLSIFLGWHIDMHALHVLNIHINIKCYKDLVNHVNSI